MTRPKIEAPPDYAAMLKHFPTRDLEALAVAFERDRCKALERGRADQVAFCDARLPLLRTELELRRAQNILKN